jgi:AraC-like DNA-binding protein
LWKQIGGTKQLLEAFSTDLWQPGDRAELWHDVVNGVHFRCDFTSQDEVPYRGSLSTCKAGRFRLTDFTTAPAKVRRTRQHIGADCEADYGLIVPIEGIFRLLHMGEETLCPPGGCLLLDGAEPFTFLQTHTIHALVLRLPRSFLEDRFADPHAFCAAYIPCREGMGKVAVESLFALCREIGSIGAEAAAPAVQAAAELLALALYSNMDIASNETTTRIANFKRLQRYINHELASPDLSPEVIATACGISLSYVHDLFRLSGETLGSYVRKQRLRRAREMLENPLMAGKSITEIAFECGFSNSSHFSRIFKDYYDLTPRDIRRSFC